MRILVVALALASGLAAPAAAASLRYSGVQFEAQAPRGGQAEGRGERAQGREARPERREEREERRERLSEDERRALHRDLDKANRELYQRRER